MLHRLTYASSARAALQRADVESILEVARERNARHDITGFLVCDSEQFLQTLEGEAEALSALYTRLARDPRHHRLLLLGFEPIGERRFCDWSMGFALADAANAALFLRHGPSRRFEPRRLDGAAALALIAALAERRPAA